MFAAFNISGLGYIEEFAHFIPMRPLHLLAYALQWLIGAGQPIGVAAGTGLLLIARYYVTRWAVSPLLNGCDRWIVSILAATLTFWPGAWLGRYGSAQLSAVFFFVSLGFAIRVHQKFSTAKVVGFVVASVLMLVTYQGLTLCLLALPFASFLWGQTDDVATVGKYSRAKAAGRVLFALMLSFTAYGVYWFIVSKVLGNAGYEGALAGDSSRLLTVSGLVAHIEAAYSTAFTQTSYLLPYLLLISFYLCKLALDKQETAKSLLLMSGLGVALVGMLPLLSLIYVSSVHIRDLDRVLFPISAGFVLVCLSLLIRCRSGNFISENYIGASILVAVLVTSSTISAYESYRYARLQVSVIDQVWTVSKNNNSKLVVIRDMTGALGDVYTLYGPTLSDAMSVLGRDLKGTICTPLSVDRIHPIAQRFPIDTTVRCEDLPPAPEGTLVLKARWEDGRLVIEP
ncbi:hypothetical protein [Pseudomonas izuensis]|uniref:hypothetical protein n=1 Tax=Pseudomonas izuensis TaxID=2684212 RepID=UPI00135B1A66|nr:hypothetical protein [Pseudomonas izuensis]